MKNYIEIIDKLELQRVKFSSVEEKEDHNVWYLKLGISYE